MFHLFFILIVLCTITNATHCAQNNTKNAELIIFNEGSDTKIPKTFFVLDYKHGHQKHTVLGTGTIDVRERFEDIFSEEISVLKKGTNEERMIIFRPTIIKVTNNTLKNLGSLLFNSHKEMHHAINLDKAIFYCHKQGAIIYFLDKPNVEIIKNNQKVINDMIESNIPQNIFLQLFRTFSGF